MYKDPRPIDMQLGAALYLWRNLYGLDQGQTAHRAGLSRQVYNRMENSHSTPTIITFLKLAHGLNIPPRLLALTMEALA